MHATFQQTRHILQDINANYVVTILGILSEPLNIPATQLTTSLCCRILCTILPSLNDMTWKLFSQLPHDIKKFSEGVCIVAKHWAPSSTFSGTGIPILRGESMSEPTPKNGSCWKLEVVSLLMKPNIILIKIHQINIQMYFSVSDETKPNLGTRKCKISTRL